VLPEMLVDRDREQGTLNAFMLIKRRDSAALKTACAG
jgi:hypothetical protein